jgi:homopolymeric O-antigen transport system permease protein
MHEGFVRREHSNPMGVEKALAVNRSFRKGNVSALTELWQYRELLRSLVIRDLKVKYQRSLLGLIWTLLNPLMTVVILVTVFSYIIRIQIDHYWAFLISGFFVWNFISQVLSYTTTLLSSNASLSRSVYFPREILVLSAVCSKLVEFLVEISIVLVVLFIFHYDFIPSSLMLLPVLILIQVVLTAGLMFPLAVISVLFYDVQHALPILIASVFYLTPVFYPASLIPKEIRPLYYLNPFAGLLSLYHTVLYEAAWPSLTLLGSVSAAAAGILVLGYWVFRRYKGVCVEIV